VIKGRGPDSFEVIPRRDRGRRRKKIIYKSKSRKHRQERKSCLSNETKKGGGDQKSNKEKRNGNQHQTIHPETIEYRPHVCAKMKSPVVKDNQETFHQADAEGRGTRRGGSKKKPKELPFTKRRAGEGVTLLSIQNKKRRESENSEKKKSTKHHKVTGIMDKKTVNPEEPKTALHQEELVRNKITLQTQKKRKK